MKLSTLASRVAKRLELGTVRWGKRYMKTPQGRYCVLGIAAQEITLSKHLQTGDAAPDELYNQDDLTIKDEQKIEQLNLFDREFSYFTQECGLHSPAAPGWPGISLVGFNDHPRTTRKDVIREMKRFSKWLRKNGL